MKVQAAMRNCVVFIPNTQQYAVEGRLGDLLVARVFQL